MDGQAVVEPLMKIITTLFSVEGFRKDFVGIPELTKGTFVKAPRIRAIAKASGYEIKRGSYTNNELVVDTYEQRKAGIMKKARLTEVMQLADYYLRQLHAHDIETSLAYSEEDIKQMAESIAKMFSAKMFASPVLSIRNLHQAVNIPVSRIRKMMAVIGLVERPDKKNVLQDTKTLGERRQILLEELYVGEFVTLYDWWQANKERTVDELEALIQRRNETTYTPSAKMIAKLKQKEDKLIGVWEQARAKQSKREFKFTVPLPPQPAVRPRFNASGYVTRRGQTHNNPVYAKWRADFEEWFSNWLIETNGELLNYLAFKVGSNQEKLVRKKTGFINDFYGYQMQLVFVCERPKTVTKTFPTSKEIGDIDNFTKAVLDGIFQSEQIKPTRLDDKLVQIVRATKRFTKLDSDEKPHIEVTLVQITDELPVMKSIVTPLSPANVEELIVPLAPQPATRPRFNDRGYTTQVYIGEKYGKWREQFDYWLGTYLNENAALIEKLVTLSKSDRLIWSPKGYDKEFNGFSIQLEFVIARPKTVYRPYPINRQDGDVDNLTKAVLDGLFQSPQLEGLHLDDRLVQDLMAVKRYTKLDGNEQPHIKIRIAQIS